MNENNNSKLTFQDKHPKLNTLIGLVLLLLFASIGLFLLYWIVNWIGEGINWIVEKASKLEAVVVVALITGGVSIVSVLITSVVGKIIDYRKSRKEYLAKKREEPYSKFIDLFFGKRLISGTDYQSSNSVR